MMWIRKIFPLWTVLCLGLVCAAASAVTEDPACFTVLVGRNASADGSVLLAHNEDDWGDNTVNVRRIPPFDYGEVRLVELGEGAVYETDGWTAGFFWVEVAPQEFSDVFVNEHGVAVVSNSCPTRETKSDLTDGGIGYMLRRIVAEKARTARAAVLLAGELIEKFGYRGSGRAYAFADKNEAWMLQVVRGRRWVAQRVPDDEVAVIPNHMTIRRVRLDDPAEFLGSKDIVAYAADNGWYDVERDGPFDFKKAYTLPPGDLLSNPNTLRHWRGLSLLTGRDWPVSDDYPFSVKPVRKVTAEKLMDLLRDHFEGTPYDATDGYKTGSPNRSKYRTICTMTTVNALVASLHAGKPESISVSLWMAPGKPDTTVFLPFYPALERLPEGLGMGPRTHDDAAFYRQHFQDAEFKAARGGLLTARVIDLENYVNADYGARIGALKKERDAVEREMLGGRAKLEAGFAELQARDPLRAAAALEEFVAAALERAMLLTKKLRETL